MRNRRNTTNTRKIWTWVSFVVFALISAVMLTALLKKQSPGQVISGFFSRDQSDHSIGDIGSMSNSELQRLVINLKSERDSLKGVVNDYKERFGHTTATVSVDNTTLNMRSEPNLRSQVILKVPNRSSVTVLEYDLQETYIDGSKGRWCRINYAGTIGWVWGNYLIIDPN